MGDTHWWDGSDSIPVAWVGCASWRRMHRRQWIQDASLWLGGLSLTTIAETLAKGGESPIADSEGRRSRKARSLMILWLQGGPSQLDTFDPHPGTKIGGDVKAISTSIPQIEIAYSLPRVAEQMHRVTLVRSLVSKEGDHERATYQMKTGWRPDPTIIHPSIGSILCHQTEDNIEIPRHVSIYSGQWPSRGGYLGSQYDAFQMYDPKNQLPNLRSRANEERTQRRIEGLQGVLEREFARGRFEKLDERKTQHETATAKALVMMASPQVDAFDVSRESESTLKRFGETPFGRGCLAGIRLIEQGVRCVEIGLNGWDTHANNGELQKRNSEILDNALAELLQELARRELLDSTVVVCGGEFGRTPQINVAGGRDHWQHGFSWLLAGGPFRRGCVHGATAAEPTNDPEKRLNDVDQPVSVEELHATLLHSLDIDFSREHQTPIGRPFVFSQGNKVRALLQEG